MPVTSLASTPADAAALDFFEGKVRPLLVDNCFTCHSADTKPSGGLRVDDIGGLITGGRKGPAVVPGKPEDSLLIKAITHADGAPKMPPDAKLEPEEIAILTRWIAEGAVWPQHDLPEDFGQTPDHYEYLRESHWAWQPLQNPAVPAVDDAAWPRDDVDKFILAELEKRRMSPVADAGRVDLLRRVTFDLTGLPPTPGEIEAFLADESVDAFENVVDRLLGSTAFGERWGRHWLDVARYADSTGSARNLPYPHAWRYRDYVIDALNSDKPYDEFLREQIAGDLLPATSPAQKAEQLVATGFLALGVKDVNQRFKVRFEMDNVDEQIDTVTRAILGLTVSCARCHDHKFDPIPTADYYALAGIFTSTDLCAGLRNQMGGGGMAYYDTNLVLSLSATEPDEVASKAQIEAKQQELAEARKEFRKIRDGKDAKKKRADGKTNQMVARQKVNRIEAELLELTDPAAYGPVALGVRDAGAVSDTAIRLRGEAEQIGPVVPRGFLSLVDVPNARQVNPRQSGRLELAEWLSSPENPLASRVIVNRVWRHLYGEGLVTTVDNFGVTGDSPSHPELLDHLAQQFVDDGWSTKKLIRRLVLTRAYQLSSEATEAHLAVDPANRLLWRHTPRRLDGEEIRDAALAASGELDRTRPTQSPAKELKVRELRNNGSEATEIAEAALNSVHRSVYLPLLRGLTPTSLAVFDFAEQGMVTGRRETTTVAPQALYLLNDPFIRRQSLVLAELLLAQADAADADRITLAYLRTFGRTPDSVEIGQALDFLEAFEAALATSFPAEGIAQASIPVANDLRMRAPVEAVKPEDAESDPDANPDAADQSDEPAIEVVVTPRDARTAAWAGFCQALLGSAEFRYLR